MLIFFLAGRKTYTYILLWFIHIDTAQVVAIPPQVRQQVQFIDALHQN